MVKHVLPSGFRDVERDTLKQLTMMQAPPVNTKGSRASHHQAVSTDDLLARLMESEGSEDAAKIVKDALTRGHLRSSKKEAPRPSKGVQWKDALPACTTLPIDHPLWAQMAPSLTKDFVWDDVALQPGLAWPGVKYLPPKHAPLVPYSLPLQYLERGDVMSYALFQHYSYPDKWAGPTRPWKPPQPVKLTKWEEEHEAYKEETRRQEAAIEEQKAKTEEIQRALERWRRGKKGEEVAAHVQPRQVEIKPSKQYLKAVGVLDEFRERRRRRQEASREGVGGAG